MSKLTRALPAILAAILAAAALAALAPLAAAGPIANIPGAEPTAPAAAAPVAPAPSAAPAAPAPIEAPRFELIDRGDSVEVVAHHIKATRTAIMPVRQRLEVPIAPAPNVKRMAPSDHTVKLVELAEESTPVLSVKLAFERGDVKALARFAQAVQVGDDLHLIIPRKLPEGDAAPRLPEATLPPGVAAKATPIAPIAEVKPEAKLDAKAETKPDAKPDAKPDVKPEAKLDVKPEAKLDAKTAAPAAAATAPVLGPAPDPHAAAAPTAATAPVLGPRPDPSAAAPGATRNDTATAVPTARPRSAADAIAAGAPHAGSTAAAATTDTRSLRPALAGDRDDEWSKISLLAALGLAAAAGGVWLMRRRRARPGAPTSIEVIAQRSLGGKARIVWLSAGQHEMIVSVTAQQVRMLSQWRKTETAPALPALYDRGDEPRMPTGSFPPPLADKPLSPAVSGLLRLRRTSQMAAVAVEPDEAEPDRDVRADDLWAKEILAATGARR
jgi:flagellar biosynthesis protein FliO